MTVARVFVAGAGLMGHGIAQVHARIGKTVLLYEPELGRAAAGRDRVAASLERAVARAQLDATARDVILRRIEATSDLMRAAEADLVIEAVFEDPAVKSRLFRDLDAIAPATTLFATNTSAISIDELGAAVGPDRRQRFAGMHFFSPVPVMPLVELVRGNATSEETVATLHELAAELGMRVISSADRPGFIVNRVLMPMLAEAMRALEQGVGSAEDVDTGARLGLRHPMGPLELADFIGLDVCLGILRVMHEGLGAEQFRPPAILEKLVAAGHLGRKTGRGFHVYPGVVNT